MSKFSGVKHLALRAALLGAVLALCSLASAPAAFAQKISAVKVVGNAQAEESLIFQSFGLSAGDDYDMETVRKGIRNLYRQGLFRDVRVDVVQTADGYEVTIEVEENPTLLRIRYDGADKVKEKDFKEVVQLVPGQIVSASEVDQARRDILDLYEEKGYLLAKVTPELKGDRRADLTFFIEEGKKVQVKKIRFNGNENVSSDDLRGTMETKEDRWWRGGDFKQDKFEEDKKKILAKLGESGFVDARITNVEKTFSENQEDLFLDIEVHEGPQYRVGVIDIDHGGVLPENQIRNTILVREGAPFNTMLFEETTANLYSLFHEQGYIYANIDTRRVPRGENVIDIELRIVERDPARINRIIITGNTKTKDKVIRRQLVASPGDIFKRSRVIRSQREVFQLGYFNDIQLDSRTADRTTGDIDLLLNVEERQTGTASLGAGINSQSGLTGFLQLSQNNFLGNGQIVSLRAEFGRFREFEMSFTEPWLFDTPTSAGFDLFDSRRRFSEYTEKRRGGALRVGRNLPWLDYTRLSLRYSNADYTIEAEPLFKNQIGDIVYDPITGEPERDAVTGEIVRTGIDESLVSSLSATFLRNSVDSPFFPTRGTRTTWTNELGGTFLGGDEDFYQMIFSATSYFRTVDKFVLSLTGRMGFLQGLRSPDDVPFWKRFRLGGISRYGVRGYTDFEIVPDPLNSSIGGRSMMIVQAELRYPIVQAIQALAFFDAGNTWATPGLTDLTDLKKGAGFGVRIDVPMVGQLGFDYGYGFDRTILEGGPGWEFHFQIGGQAF